MIPAKDHDNRRGADANTPSRFLARFFPALFTAAGVPAGEAEVVSRSLVDANLCGHDSHGVMRVPQYVGFIREKKLFCDVPLQTLHETPAMYSADAGWGSARCKRIACGRLLPKAALGIAAGTLRRCGHIGRLGEYAEWAARQGMAFFATVNSHGCGRRVAPPGGARHASARIRSASGPTPTDPLVLDIGTSAVAEGKVRVKFPEREGPPTAGCSTTGADRPTTRGRSTANRQARSSRSAAPRPTRASAWASARRAGRRSVGRRVQQAGSAAARPGQHCVFVLFDTRHFGGNEHFLKRPAPRRFVRHAHGAGVKSIMLPGDPERLSKAKRQIEGIPISDGTCRCC